MLKMSRYAEMHKMSHLSQHFQASIFVKLKRSLWSGNLVYCIITHVYENCFSFPFLKDFRWWESLNRLISFIFNIYSDFSKSVNIMYKKPQNSFQYKHYFYAKCKYYSNDNKNINKLRVTRSWQGDQSLKIWAPWSPSPATNYILTLFTLSR